MSGYRGDLLDPRAYGPTSHISERDLLRGYSGLRRKRRRRQMADAEIAAHANGTAVPPVLLLRGRRCPCGSHDGPMSDLERRQRERAAMTIAAGRAAEEVAS